jgi:mannose-6-phosphate isomerase-like protein (cupin superfamily)
VPAEPTITFGPASDGPRFSAEGRTLVLREWRGSGPAQLHVHHEDDEAFHVLDGTLRFRFADRTVDVPAGGTVFVPAGVAHAYEAIEARYLAILTPRLDALIQALHQTREPQAVRAIYRQYASDLLE